MADLKTVKEVQRRVRKLRPAIDDPSTVEIYRLAALQVVAQKLEEVASLLRSIQQPQPQATSPRSSFPAQTMPMTVENVNKIANPPIQQTGPACQICGQRPVVVKNSRGMTACAQHAAMVTDDDRNAMANSKLQAMLSKGFGDMEVIQVTGNANESE